MRRRLAPSEKPLFWIGSSKRDLLAMPDPVVRQMGAALSVAQYGGKHRDAKPWKGLGPGVFEVVSDYKTDRPTRFAQGMWCDLSMRCTSCTVFRRNRQVEGARRRRMLK
jgi:phage-related protein